MNYDMGNRLRKLRQEFNLSQKELANLIGMTVCGYQLWECGERDGKFVNPRLNHLVALSQVFGIPINDLIGVEVENVNPPYGGLYNSEGWWWYRLHRRGHLSQEKFGPFPSKGEALTSLKVHLNAISEREKDVHPGRGLHDGRPGPGQCGPEGSDMGKRLQRDEGFIPGGEKALPGNRP